LSRAGSRLRPTIELDVTDYLEGAPSRSQRRRLEAHLAVYRRWRAEED
jgi:hypothetical protein